MFESGPIRTQVCRRRTKHRPHRLNRQTDRQTDRQTTNKQPNKQTNKHTPHNTPGEASWFSARTLSFHHCSPMQLATGCMWIWFADSIPALALVGFLRALRFPPGVSSYTYKLESFHICWLILPYLLIVNCDCWSYNHTHSL